MDGKQLVDEFVKLVKVPSPSGKERPTAEYIMSRLKSMGVNSYLDKTNAGTENNSGNVIAHISGEGPAIMFLAHMDTMETVGVPINPIIENGTIRSDGNTVLGADNKGGVASLIGAIEEFKAMPNKPNIICAFTTDEERSMLGAKAIELDDNIDFIFDIDGGGDPGAFVTKALGSKHFVVKFNGKEAHAARAPEQGKNAIHAAGIFVTSLKLGKNEAGSTMNIGLMSGGRATNVIPAYAELTGETRAYTTEAIENRIKEVQSAAKAACKATGCTYEFSSPEHAYIPPFETPHDQKIVKLAKAACEDVNMKFEPFTLDACVQANVIASRTNCPVIELCRGGGGAHSPSEWTTEKYLLDAKNLIVSIVRNSSKFVQPQ